MVSDLPGELVSMHSPEVVAQRGTTPKLKEVEEGKSLLGQALSQNSVVGT